MSLLDRVSRFIDDVLLLPEDVRDQLERAEQSLENGKHREAAELFGAVLDERPTLARAAVGLAQARDALGDLEGAREALKTARDLAPDDADVALLAARLALRAGDVEAASNEARDAARGLSDRASGERAHAFAEACAIRARAERLRGRPDRATRELRKALSATPEDVALRVELFEALVDTGRGAAARVAASAIDPESVDDGLAVRIGLGLHRIGAHDASGPWLERGAEAGSDLALLALARRDLRAGEVDVAEGRVRRAVARGAGSDALALLAEVALAQGRRAEAAEALAAASGTRGGDADLLRAATRVAPVDGASALVQHADALDRVAPGDPAATAARAWAAIARGEREAALPLVAVGSDPRILLARARLRLDWGAAGEALVALDAWAATASGVPFAHVDRPLAEALRRDALKALWLGPAGEVDFAGAIDAVARFAAEHGLSEMERSSAQLRDELDRPLLLAVLGEFNAGKSTFINAFVGADVAPTGIVPTTATLNVLRGGAERRVRVVRADGTTREGDYGSLRALLEEAESRRGGGAEDASRVDHVEIVLPAETLERVWILDTPGTNAIDPNHERLAREAARRADAALWIFDASQAGKGTEARMLKELSASGRVVVPVLNKADRLAGDQLEAVQDVLVEALPDLGGVVCISARDALRARLHGEPEAYDRSGFSALLERLEDQIFSRSRELKRAACAGRLLVVLEEALATEEHAVARHDERLAALEESASPLAESGDRLVDAVDDAVAHLERDLDGAFAEAAAEVLAFVKPRRHRFASHGADREDRDFLAEVLERRLGEAADAFGARLVARVRGALSLSSSITSGTAAGGGGPPLEAPPPGGALLDARVRVALWTPIALYVGTQRGTLRGGALHRFFDDFLPTATLEREAIAEALARARVDPRRELRQALLDALEVLVGALEGDRAEAVAAESRAREALHARIYAPLAALGHVLSELLGAGAER